MPFTIDRLPDLPALLYVQSDSNAAAEAESVLSNLVAALAAQPEPVFLILDLRALTISLDELASTASAAALQPNALMHHPMVRENLLITNDGIVKLAVYGMRSETFGGVTIRPFSTQEEALDYCRARIAADAGRGSHRAMTG